MIILKTERLILKTWEDEDVLAIAPVYEDPELMKFTMDGALSYEETKKVIQERQHHQERYGFSVWAMLDKESGELVGHAGIEYFSEGEDDKHLDVLVKKDFQGKGFGLEALKAIIEYAFQELELEHLIAFAKPANVRCTRIFEKITMKHKKETMLKDEYVSQFEIGKADIKWDIFKYLK